MVKRGSALVLGVCWLGGCARGGYESFPRDTDWPLAFAEWTVRHPLIVETPGGVEPLLDVPVMLRLGPAELDFATARADGADLRFVDQDGTTLLAHEQESWDAAGVILWVRIPRLTPGEAHRLWLYYGNPAAPPTNPPSAVWAGEYAAVWHLHSTLTDSTSHGNHGVDLGSASAAGLIAGGRSFDGGGGLVRVADQASLHGGAAGLTMSAWLRPRASGGWRAGLSRSTPAGNLNDFWLGFYQDRFRCMTGDGSAEDAAFGAVIELNRWCHLACTSDGVTLRLFVDGVEDPSAATAVTMPLANSALEVYLGGDWEDGASADEFVGEVDEARLEWTVRSPAWLAMQYHSMAGSAVSVGAAERRPPFSRP